MTLNEHVRDLAIKSGKHYSEIAELAGSSPSWGKAFMRGHITSPTVDRIERLYEALTGQKLVG